MVLLTREELKPIYHAAFARFQDAVARGDEIAEDSAAYVNEAVARAQVRKVADEMAKFFGMAQLTSPDSLEPPPSIEYLAGEFYKALRKAAGDTD